MSLINLEGFFQRLRLKAPCVLLAGLHPNSQSCADAILAVGAKSALSDDPEDAEYLAKTIMSAVVMNIGSANKHSQEVMLAAGRGALEARRPVVLDPQAANASPARMNMAQKLISETKPNIIRGNSYEINALLNPTQETIPSDTFEAAKIAVAMARKLGAVIVINGRTDIATDGQTLYRIAGSSPLLTKILGAGSLLSALIGAYAAANPGELLKSAVAGVIHMALAAERAAGSLPSYQKLGLFKVELFDRLAEINSSDLTRFQGISL